MAKVKSSSSNNSFKIYWQFHCVNVSQTQTLLWLNRTKHKSHILTKFTRDPARTQNDEPFKPFECWKKFLKWFWKLRETSKFLLTNLLYKCCVSTLDWQSVARMGGVRPSCHNKWYLWTALDFLTSCLTFCSYTELRKIIFWHSVGTRYLHRSSDRIFSTHRTDRDELVRMIHHGDQEIEKHDDVDDGEAPKHDQAPEPRELLDSSKLKVV